MKKTKEETTNDAEKTRTRKIPDMTDAYRLGERTEKRVKLWYEEQGFYVVRSDKSRGIWDLICFKDTRILLVSVKAGNWSCSDELKAMIDFEVPPFVEKYELLWYRYRHNPEIKFISPELLLKERHPTNGRSPHKEVDAQPAAPRKLCTPDEWEQKLTLDRMAQVLAMRSLLGSGAGSQVTVKD
jgi:Holliday junction resolvase